MSGFHPGDPGSSPGRGISAFRSESTRNEEGRARECRKSKLSEASRISKKEKMKPNQKLLKEIRDRYSPRKFKSKQIPEKTLNLILEAARWAPSGFNNQPWRYIIVNKSHKTRAALEKSLLPGNGWAKTAPTLIVCHTNKKFQKSGNDIPYHVYDSALSVMSLVIEAEHQGLKSHQMGGFSKSKVQKALNIPDDHDVLVVIALGYEDRALKLKDKITNKIAEVIARPRTRKPITDFVKQESF
jgi:nitroreductase